MALTITNLNRDVSGNRRRHTFDVQFDSSYPTGGESLTKAQMGLHKVTSVLATINPDGADTTAYTFGWDATNEKLLAYRASPSGTVAAPTFTGTAPAGTSGVVTDNDNAATLGHALYVLPVSITAPAPSALQVEATASGLIKDSDTAAADGVAVYVVVDDPNWSATYQLGHFEFVSPTNVNGTCTIKNGGATLTLFDDDSAASNGVATRIVAAVGGWEATTAASKDILVPLSNGKFIHVNHATTGSTPQVYFDEDAANTYERLQAVVVDNADEDYKVFVNSVAATEDIPVNLNQGALRLGQIVTVGPKPFSPTIGSGGPEITVASRPDAASLPGAVVLTVAAAGAGLQAANFGKEDLFIPTSTGEYLKVAYAASPAGPQVYGYPEGATADVRLLAVVVDNLDEAIATEASIGAKRDTPAGTNSAPTFTGTAAGLAEVSAGVDLSAVNCFVEAVGW